MDSRQNRPYDAPARLVHAQRGTLDFTDRDDPAITDGTKYQSWDLDGLGNFSEFDDNGSVQTREVNAANEITSDYGIPTPSYDAAGNMTNAAPRAYRYDAWNRQKEVLATSGGTQYVMAEYAYDGVGRRITRAHNGPPGTLDSSYTSEDYYSNRQLIETWDFAFIPSAPSKQYVWSPRYVDAPILRDVYSSGEFVPAGRIYYTGDANYNVTATVNTSGSVVTRYAYDAYGEATVYSPTWTNPAAAVESGPLYCGYRFDGDIGNYYVRNRYYSVALATWFSRDPIGYKGGINLYEYVGDSPLTRTDPTGNVGTDGPMDPTKPMWPGGPIPANAQGGGPSASEICCKAKKSAACAQCSCDDIKNLFNAAFSHHASLGPDHCHRWAETFIDSQKQKPSPCYSLGKAEWHYSLYDWPPFSWSPFGALGHGAVRVTMCDGTVFYFDDGLWGGNFWPSAIPPWVVVDK